MPQPPKPKSICVECVHYGDEDRTAARDDVECKASPRPKATDPVSGRELPYREIELTGRFSFGGRTHELCREVNTGDCRLFKGADES